MNKKISLLTFVLSLILVAVLVFMATFTVLSDRHRAELAKAYEEETVSGDETLPDDPGFPIIEEQFYTEKLDLIRQLFELYSYFEMDEEAILDGILKGFAGGTGDRYAEYYTAEEFALISAENQGEMQGVGINIIYNADYKVIEVINVMPDSPAMKAGVLPGDLITAVGIGDDAQSVATLGYTPSVALLQGKAGTICEFTVQRGVNYEETLTFSIERGYVSIQSVTHHLYEADNSVGVIRIFEFDAKTPEQFKAAIADLQSKGAKKFIFDVRNNPGGDLDSICSILDFILPEGPIIRMKDNTGAESSIDSDAEEFNAPMVVLCNGSSASAAELFTSALMDYDKAVSIGELTYGKGSMQSLIPISDGSCFKLTTKMYFPPFSEGYDGIGITPDVESPMPEGLENVNIYGLSDNEDPQLQRAVQYLNENY